MDFSFKISILELVNRHILRETSVMNEEVVKSPDLGPVSPNIIYGPITPTTCKYKSPLNLDLS